MSAETSGQLICRGVGQNVSPRERIDISSVDKEQLDRLITEEWSKWMLAGLVLRRERLRVTFLRISGFTKICNKKISFQCIIFIVPEEGWFGQPKYSTHIKTFLRCTGFCLYFLHFIYVKPVRSPLIQRTPAGSSFRLLAQTFYSHFQLQP